MTILLRQIVTAAPRHARSLSVVDNFKSFFGKVTPSASAPSPVVPGLVEESQRIASRRYEFDYDVPQRRYGEELKTGLAASFESVLGTESSSIPEDKKLELVQVMYEMTGRRLPDHVLNQAKHKDEIVDFFAKEDSATDKLVLDEAQLPSNVHILPHPHTSDFSRGKPRPQRTERLVKEKEAMAEY